MHAAVIFEAVNAADVRMIERREDLRLALEAGEPIRITRKGRWQYLNRDVAIELGVVRAIHLAHAADAEQAIDAEYADLPADLGPVGHFRRAAERRGSPERGNSKAMNRCAGGIVTGGDADAETRE